MLIATIIAIVASHRYRVCTVIMAFSERLLLDGWGRKSQHFLAEFRICFPLSDCRQVHGR